MSVTAAQGFRASGVSIGLKPSRRPDMALLVNDGPLAVGGRGLHDEPVPGAPGGMEPAGRLRRCRARRDL